MNEKNNNNYPSVSVIVPTFEEVLNIPILIKKIDEITQNNNLKLNYS